MAQTYISTIQNWKDVDHIRTLEEDLDALINGLKFKKLTDQYSFHTDKVLLYLKPVGEI